MISEDKATAIGNLMEHIGLKKTKNGVKPHVSICFLFFEKMREFFPLSSCNIVQGLYLPKTRCAVDCSSICMLFRVHCLGFTSNAPFFKEIKKNDIMKATDIKQIRISIKKGIQP